jgi:Protein of unknown function (DUF2924)
MDTCLEVLMEETNSSSRRRRSLRDVSVSESLEQKIAHISRLDAAALQKSWKAAFGVAPSSSLSRSFMLRALAYRLQEKAPGALKPAALRILVRIGDGQSPVELERTPKRRPPAGTVLIRQWRGVSHRVTVLDDNVVYRGRRYKSLSEVARLITGSRWSGPMFFGLRNRNKEVANG